MLLTSCSDSAQGPRVCERSNERTLQGPEAGLGGNGSSDSIHRNLLLCLGPLFLLGLSPNFS